MKNEVAKKNPTKTVFGILGNGEKRASDTTRLYIFMLLSVDYLKNFFKLDFMLIKNLKTFKNLLLFGQRIQKFTSLPTRKFINSSSF